MQRSRSRLCFARPVEANRIASSSVQKRKLAVIGGALDLGAGRRGVDMGPSASATRAWTTAWRAGSSARTGERRDAAGRTAAGDPSARFLTEIKDVRADRPSCRGAARGSSVPIVLGGDHSVALGTLGGLAAVHGAGGVLWFDAHGDLNTPETSPSGNVHGMPLAAALGLAATPSERRMAAPGRGIRARRPHRRALPRRRRARTGATARRARLHDERSRPARRRAGVREYSSAWRTRHSSTSPSTWTWSTPTSLREWARPCAAACPTAKPTSRWSSSPSPASRLDRDRRGEPDPRSRERDRRARRRARRQRPRRKNSLGLQERVDHSGGLSNASHRTLCPPGTTSSVSRSPSARR